jgi:hypothetical protein
LDRFLASHLRLALTYACLSLLRPLAAQTVLRSIDRPHGANLRTPTAHSPAMEPLDAEHRHYLEVVASFRDYANWMNAEAGRRERHLAALEPKWKALLPSAAFEPKAAALREAVAVNAAFLDAVASEQDVSGLGLQFQRGEHGSSGCGDDDGHGHDHHGHGHDHHGHGHSHSSRGAPAAAAAAAASSDATPAAAPGSSSGRPTSSLAHYSKVRSTLHQCVRDWAAEGAPERDASYGPLIAELQRLLPVNAGNVNAQRVLVPGCGLGRLLYELCARGYAAQGNEFSFQMLFTAHVILNVLRQKEAAVIHPFIHDARCVSGAGGREGVGSCVGSLRTVMNAAASHPAPVAAAAATAIPLARAATTCGRRTCCARYGYRTWCRWCSRRRPTRAPT